MTETVEQPLIKRQYSGENPLKEKAVFLSQLLVDKNRSENYFEKLQTSKSDHQKTEMIDFLGNEKQIQLFQKAVASSLHIELDKITDADLETMRKQSYLDHETYEGLLLISRQNKLRVLNQQSITRER